MLATDVVPNKPGAAGCVVAADATAAAGPKLNLAGAAETGADVVTAPKAGKDVAVVGPKESTGAVGAAVLDTPKAGAAAAGPKARVGLAEGTAGAAVDATGVEKSPVLNDGVEMEAPNNPVGG